jgi:WD40 repeat protein
VATHFLPMLEPGLIVLFLLILAPVLFASYIMHSQGSPSSTTTTNKNKINVEKSTSLKTVTLNPNPKEKSQEKKSQEKKSQEKKISKKKKLAPPKHSRFVGWVKGHSSNVVACSISPDGQFLASSCEDRTLRVTRLNDCLRIPGQPNGHSPPLYMSTQTNFTTLTSLCWVSSSAGAIIVGVQESDRCAVFYKCKPKQKNSDSNKSNKSKYQSQSKITAEKLKLEKQLKELVLEYNALSKKLQNNNYVNNAPKNIVDTEKKKIRNLENSMNSIKEKISILLKMKKDATKKSSDFKYEIKQLMKKSIQTNLLDTCRFVAIDQTFSNQLQPNLVLGFSDGSTSLRSVIYSLDGRELTAFKTKPGTSVGDKGYCFATSKDCKLIAVSLCSDTVAIHKHEASGMTRKPVMSLTGCHNGMVTSIALGGRASSKNHNDTDRACLCSRDGTWSLWKIDVQFKFDEEPIMLYQSDQISTTLTKIAISPGGKCVAIAGGTNGNELFIYSLRDAGIHDKGTIELVEKIEIGHAEGAISHLQFGPCGTFVAASSNSSRIIYLWSTKM